MNVVRIVNLLESLRGDNHSFQYAQFLIGILEVFGGDVCDDRQEWFAKGMAKEKCKAFCCDVEYGRFLSKAGSKK